MSHRKTIEEVQQAAHHIRKHVLRLTIERNGCYLSQACSAAELLSTMYLRVLNLTESRAPKLPEAFPGTPSKDNMDYIQGAEYHGELKAPYDRFFISPAHYAAPVYAALIEAGRLSPDSLEMFNRDGYSMEMIGANHTPGFENAAGTLDQAISVAGGTAHARKLRGEQGTIYVMMSDGEMQEGQLWEAIQAAAFYKLDNLVLLVDVNGQQVEGTTDDTMKIEPLAQRFTAFGAKTVEVNGHDIQAIEDATQQGEKDKPLVILCYTDPTQGIPYLNERRPILHFVRLKAGEEYDKYVKFYNEM
ncbi:transketolase [Enterococcus florum]|uniref:Transketolase n=1 Tax=Enterococcus florum TaxID=2480627 RepID=A0A4P5P5Q4_9ENTE|nr:thiamine pyrophosphate-dependent enzyme [Enterococcus florum]GCF93175.1 transketolase [Enterococcus florum]